MRRPSKPQQPPSCSPYLILVIEVDPEGRCRWFKKVSSSHVSFCAKEIAFARRPLLPVQETVCDVRFVKVFGCRPRTAARHTPGAGVRKPPREETAGRVRGWCGVRYGDLSAADEVCDWD